MLGTYVFTIVISSWIDPLIIMQCPSFVSCNSLYFKDLDLSIYFCSSISFFPQLQVISSHACSDEYSGKIQLKILQMSRVFSSKSFQALHPVNSSHLSLHDFQHNFLNFGRPQPGKFPCSYLGKSQYSFVSHVSGISVSLPVIQCLECQGFMFCPVFYCFRWEGKQFSIIPSSPAVQISNKHLVRVGLTVELGFIFKNRVAMNSLSHTLLQFFTNIFGELNCWIKRQAYFDRYCQLAFPIQTSIYLE